MQDFLLCWAQSWTFVRQRRQCEQASLHGSGTALDCRRDQRRERWADRGEVVAGNPLAELDKIRRNCHSIAAGKYVLDGFKGRVWRRARTHDPARCWRIPTAQGHCDGVAWGEYAQIRADCIGQPTTGDVDGSIDTDSNPTNNGLGKQFVHASIVYTPRHVG